MAISNARTLGHAVHRAAPFFQAPDDTTNPAASLFSPDSVVITGSSRGKPITILVSDGHTGRIQANLAQRGGFELHGRRQFPLGHVMCPGSQRQPEGNPAQQFEAGLGRQPGPDSQKVAPSLEGGVVVATARPENRWKTVSLINDKEAALGLLRSQKRTLGQQLVELAAPSLNQGQDPTLRAAAEAAIAHAMAAGATLLITDAHQADSSARGTITELGEGQFGETRAHHNFGLAVMADLDPLMNESEPGGVGGEQTGFRPGPASVPGMWFRRES